MESLPPLKAAARFLADHPAAYWAAVAASAVASTLIASRMARTKGIASLAWAGLAVLQSGLAAGLLKTDAGKARPKRGGRTKRPVARMARHA